jgi:hypothetical protein
MAKKKQKQTELDADELRVQAVKLFNALMAGLHIDIVLSYRDKNTKRLKKQKYTFLMSTDWTICVLHDDGKLEVFSNTFQALPILASQMTAADREKLDAVLENIFVKGVTDAEPPVE